MKRSTAAIARVLTAVIGLGLIFGGGSSIMWRYRVGVARRLFAHIDRRWYATAGQQPWWSWAIAIVTIVAVVGGVALLVATLRPRRLGTIELDQSIQPPGVSTLSASTLAGAVAAGIAKHGVVQSARGHAILDRGVPTLRITMISTPDVSLRTLESLAARARTELINAIGDIGPNTQFFVRYLPVGSPPTTMP